MYILNLMWENGILKEHVGMSELKKEGKEPKNLLVLSALFLEEDASSLASWTHACILTGPGPLNPPVDDWIKVLSPLFQGAVCHVRRDAPRDRKSGPDAARLGPAQWTLRADAARTHPGRVVRALLHTHAARQRLVRRHHQGANLSVVSGFRSSFASGPNSKNPART